jgi:transcriptional regulator with XRE-family HTH domain
MQATDLLTHWGSRLTQARQEKNLSIGELARRAGMHKSHLARFEKGEAGLGDDLRIRIATEVGHEVSALFPYPTTTQDDQCRSADSAAGPAASATPATMAATRSPARSVAEPEVSAPSEIRASADASGDL